MRGLDAKKKRAWQVVERTSGAVERQSEDVDGGKNREATEGEGERGGLLKTGKKQRR